MNAINKIFGFALGVVIFTSVVWQSVIIVHFYVNQAEIEAAYCVNKERPELNCHGQCHLNETLNQDVNSSQVQNAPIPAPRAGLVVLQFQSITNDLEFNSFEHKLKQLFNSIIKKTQTYHPSVFDPPQRFQVV